MKVSGAADLLVEVEVEPHQVDNNLLSHPVLGLEKFSAFALMEPFRNTYGTFQATDFQQLYLEPLPEDQKHH